MTLMISVILRTDRLTDRPPFLEEPS